MSSVRGGWNTFASGWVGHTISEYNDWGARAPCKQISVDHSTFLTERNSRIHADRNQLYSEPVQLIWLLQHLGNIAFVNFSSGGGLNSAIQSQTARSANLQQLPKIQRQRLSQHLQYRARGSWTVIPHTICTSGRWLLKMTRMSHNAQVKKVHCVNVNKLWEHLVKSSAVRRICWKTLMKNENSSRWQTIITIVAVLKCLWWNCVFSWLSLIKHTSDNTIGWRVLTWNTLNLNITAVFELTEHTEPQRTWRWMLEFNFYDNIKVAPLYWFYVMYSGFLSNTCLLVVEMLHNNTVLGKSNTTSGEVFGDRDPFLTKTVPTRRPNIKNKQWECQSRIVSL